MKTLTTMAFLALCCVVLAGCGDGKKKEEEKKENAGKAGTTKVVLEKDLCAKCGCCAKCDDCCKEGADMCDCGFMKGSELCCVDGLKPADGVYCKSCGEVKESDDCCKEGAAKCDCGMQKGAPLCCKLKSDDHDHAEGDKDVDSHDKD